MRRLNFGAGPDRADGWESCDADARWATRSPLDHIIDIAIRRLDVADGSYDSIVASHSLQQIEYHALPTALRELRRVLKPGGTLRVILPDLWRAIGAYEMGDRMHFQVPDSAEDTLDGKLCAYLTWYSSARMIWTAEAFTQQLARVGFPAISSVFARVSSSYDPDICRWDKREGESFFLEAVRP